MAAPQQRMGSGAEVLLEEMAKAFLVPPPMLLKITSRHPGES